MALLNLLGLAGLLLFSSVVKSQTQCPYQGRTPLKQKGEHNYVIDLFAGMEFPFAINKCTATDIISNNKWYKYTCTELNSTEEYKITKTEYVTSNCTGNATELTNWYVDKPDFECEGMNTFVELQISLSTDCSSGVTVFAGLGTCVDANLYTQYEFYCNSSMTSVQFYNKYLETTMTPTEIYTTTSLMTSELLTSTSVASTGVSTSTGVATSTIGATTSTTGATTSTAGTTTSKTGATTTRTSASGKALIATQIVSTLTGTQESYPMCDDSEFCDVWIISRRNCASSSLFSQNTSTTNIFAQMVQCHPIDIHVTLPGKSSSVRPHLAIGGIITSLLFGFLI